MTTNVQRPHLGADEEAEEVPYVFISYSHQDKARVLNEIQMLREAKLRVWFDDGIVPAAEWSSTIAEKIGSCGVFVVFLTKESSASPHVLDEIRFAFRKNRKVIYILLDQFDLPDGLLLHLDRMQGIMKYELTDYDYKRKFLQGITTCMAKPDLFGRRRHSRVLRVLSLVKYWIRKHPVHALLLVLMLSTLSALGYGEVAKTRHDLILIGSGTAFNFIEQEFPQMLKQGTLRVVPLDAASGLAISVVVNTYARSTAKASTLPSLIGMAAFDVNDGAFMIPDPIDPKDKFYAIQMATDKLVVSLPQRLIPLALKEQAKRPEPGARLPEISLQELAGLMDAGLTQQKPAVFTTIPQSGTYKMWEKLFLDHNLSWPGKEGIKRFVVQSVDSQHVIATTQEPWIALSSEFYNVAPAKEVECCNFYVTQNGQCIERPIYFFGQIEQFVQKYKGHDIYRISDEFVCSFWKNWLKRMDSQDRYKALAKRIRSEFMIELEDGKLGILNQPQHEKVMLFK